MINEEATVASLCASLAHVFEDNKKEQLICMYGDTMLIYYVYRHP